MNKLGKNKTALIAIVTGLSLFIMAIAAFWGISGLEQVELGLATAHPMLDEASLRKSIVGWLIILIADIVVAWGLHQLLESIDREVSLLTAWFRMVYVVFLGIAIAFLIQGTAIDATIINSELVRDWNASITTFREVWSFGLIVFGFHLLGLGYLCLKTNFIPKLLGILISLAGIGYVIVHGGHATVAGFDAYQSSIEMVFMVPMIFGELGLAFWLLFKRNNLME